MQENTYRGSRSPFWIIALWSLIPGLLVSVSVIFVDGDTRSVAVALAFLPSILIAGSLVVTRQREIFHPLTFVFLTICFGVTVQTIYLFYLDDGGHRFAIGVLNDENTMITAIAAISVGVVFLLIGYTFTSGGAPLRQRNDVAWSISRVKIVVIICLVIGVASLAYYMSVFDVLSNLREQFSVKRRFVDQQTGVSATLSYVRFGVNFSQLAFFISYAAYLQRGNKSETFLKSLMILSAFASVVMPIVASSRSGLIVFVLGGAMIHHFSTGGWSIKRIRHIGIILVCLILIMGMFRYTQSRGISFSEYRSDVSVQKMFEPILGSSNFLGVGKTAVVIDSVPNAIGYQYGRTYLLWLVGPVPRSLWPEKPVIRIGAILGAAIFGTTLKGGVPPGIIGELYFNFGWLGIPLGMFLYGVFLCQINRRYCQPSYTDINKRTIYSVIIVFVAFTGLSADFTGMVSMTLQRLIPLLVILRFIRIKPQTRVAI